MRTNISYVIIFLICVFVTASCEKVEKINTLGETEYCFDERLSSLSSGADSIVWVGGETGALWRLRGDERRVYDIGEDRIYKVVSEKNDSRKEICWIGVRNSGLQKWEMDEHGARNLKTYFIPQKKNRYSPYDIALIRDSVYVATSQGFYVLSPKASPDSLRLLYPSQDVWDSLYNKSFVVNNLCSYKDSILFASTEQGVFLFDMVRHAGRVIHPGRFVDHVSVCNDTLFVLSDNTLFLNRTDGGLLKEIQLEFAPKLCYRAGGVYYLAGTDNLLLSDDLDKFVLIPLRRKIPAGCRNVVMPDPNKDFTLLLTERALWRVPHHLGIFNGDISVKAACMEADFLYYLTSGNELYRQRKGEFSASQICSFPKEEQIVWMDMSGNRLYYRNTRQEVKRLKVSGNLMENRLFHSPATVYRSKDKITASWLKKKKDGDELLLGVQDGLVIVGEDGGADTVSVFKDRYVTSFFAPRHSGLLYLSTLNDGIFYVSPDTAFKPVPGTEKNSFIRDLIATGGYRPALITLTNHHILSQNPDDTLRVRGYNRLLYVNDTLFYALPEFGIRKFSISGGRICDKGKYYTDIRFNPAAAFVCNGRLCLGSDLGVLTIGIDREDAPRWVAFAPGSTFNLRFVVITAILVLGIIALAVGGYFRRRSSTKKQILRRVEALKGRVDDLELLYDLSDEASREEVACLRAEIETIDPDAAERKKTYALITRLTNDIINRNREATLCLLKKLKEQAEWIAGTEAFDKPFMLAEAAEAEKSNNIERIKSAVSGNEQWMNLLTGLERESVRYAEDMEGCLELEGVNKGLRNEFLLLKEKTAQMPLDKVNDEFLKLKRAYGHVFSGDALALILRYVEQMRCRLDEIAQPDKVSEGLGIRIDEALLCTRHDERIRLLRLLKQADDRLSLLEIKEEIAAGIGEYRHIREGITAANERLVNKKFDKELEVEIASGAKEVVKRVDRLILSMYEVLSVTDPVLLNDILRFSSYDHQQARVLALLVANPRVKRTDVPGILGLYGNLNPVISRLINNKIKANEQELKEYLKEEYPAVGFVYYILGLID